MIKKRNLDILRILNENSRVTDSYIAKELKISKQAVRYRINQMIDEKIIKMFYTDFDNSKLGFVTYYVFIELEKITSSIENELIKNISEINNVGWIINAIGKTNLILQVYAEDNNEFDKIYLQIKNIISKYLKNASFSILIDSKKLIYRFLRNKKNTLDIKNNNSCLNIDEVDKEIMKLLSKNSKISLLEISEKLKISLDKVRYRINNLKYKGIIKGFRLKIDISKLDLIWYIVLFKFQSISIENRKRFIDYLSSLEETYYVTTTIGNYDLILDLHVKNPESLKQFIQKLQDQFPNYIKDYDLLLISNEHKIDYFSY